MNSVWFALRSIYKTVVCQKTIRMIYFACAHSVMNYGIVFGGNSQNSIQIFKLQKKMVRIMTDSGSKDSCRDLFRKMGILPFYSKYIYSMLIYIINNMQLYKGTRIFIITIQEIMLIYIHRTPT